MALLSSLRIEQLQDPSVSGLYTRTLVVLQYPVETDDSQPPQFEEV